MNKVLLIFMVTISAIGHIFAMENDKVVEKEKPTLLLRNMPGEIIGDTKSILTFINNNPQVVPQEIKDILKNDLINSNKFTLIGVFKDLISKRSIELKGSVDAITSVAFRADGKFALTGSLANTARLWNLNDLSTINNSVIELVGHTEKVICVALSPDGKFALTGSRDHTARLWKLSNLNTINSICIELQGHTDVVSTVAFSPDGKFALAGCRSTLLDGFRNTALLWNLNDLSTGNGSAIQLIGHTGRISSIAFSPDGKFALTGSDDWTARLWDLRNIDAINASVTILKGGYINAAGLKVAIQAVAFNPDSKFAVTVAYSTVRLWNLSNEETINDSFTELKGHRDKVSSVAFSPDGKFILTGSYDQIARLWDLSNLDAINASVKELKGHTNDVTSVAVFPDSKYGLTGSKDIVRLWDLTDLYTNDSWINLTGHFLKAEFSPDGNFALARSMDGTARFMPLLPTLSLEQVALLVKLDHLTKNIVKANFLFNDKSETFYLKILKSFDAEEQKAIISRFKLDPKIMETA